MRQRHVVTPVLLVALLGLTAVTGTATAAEDLSVAITEETSTITIDVTRDGEPVEAATVTVSGIGNETPLDGEYRTDGRGRIIFGPDHTRNISGVVHLRLTVETETVTTSQLATITRSPDVRRSAPLGQRISMSLQDSVARTRGAVEGTMFVTDLESIDDEEGKIDVLRSHAERTLQRLDERELERQALGRRHATGDVDTATFFTQAIEISAKQSMLREDLATTLRRLDRFDDRALEKKGVRVDAMRDLRESLEREGTVPRGATVSSGR